MRGGDFGSGAGGGQRFMAFAMREVEISMMGVRRGGVLSPSNGVSASPTALRGRSAGSVTTPLEPAPGSLAENRRLWLKREDVHELGAFKWRAARTAYRRAQVSTLREQLLKLGAWVQSSIRRIVLHLPASFPRFHDWQLIARVLGAAPA